MTGAFLTRPPDKYHSVCIMQQAENSKAANMGPLGCPCPLLWNRYTLRRWTYLTKIENFGGNLRLGELDVHRVLTAMLWLTASSPVSIQTQSLALHALRKRKPQETQAIAFE